MVRTSGKRVAVAAAVVGLFTLAGAVFGLRGVLLEQWYLRQLDSSVEARRNLAAEGLAEMGSVRGARVLIKRFPKDTAWAKALIRIGPPAIPVVLAEFRARVQAGEDLSGLRAALEMLSPTQPPPAGYFRGF